MRPAGWRYPTPVLKALFFFLNSSNINCFLQKNAKKMQNAKNAKAPPLQIFGYAPDCTEGTS